MFCLFFIWFLFVCLFVMCLCLIVCLNAALVMSSIPAHVKCVWIKPLNDKDCLWLRASHWFHSILTFVQQTYIYTEHNDITEILSKVVLNTNNVLCAVSVVTHWCIILTSKHWSMSYDRSVVFSLYSCFLHQ